MTTHFEGHCKPCCYQNELLEGLLQFAENDERVNAGWLAYEEALKKAGVQYTAHHYPGTNHGFHNDTTPRYDEAAAKLAWQRTLEFFNKELGGK